MRFLACYWWFLTAYLIFCDWDNSRLFVKPAPVNPKRKKWPFVSILIPARDEEKRIGPCLEGLLKQDYPSYEVIVLDDRSTDTTLNLVRDWAKRNSRLRVIKGKELPEGWVGKPWACWQLSQKAEGDWIFYTDADTWHLPETLKRTVQMAEEKDADVLTLLTRQETRTWLESLVIPVMAYTLLAFLPTRWSLRKESFFSKFAGVSGQFIFIKRKVYEDFGGHQTVKNEIVEDLNFGKQVVRRGYRLVVGNGSDFSYCRMYLNAKEVWWGFSKNFFPATGFSFLFFLNAMWVLILNGAAPFAVLAWGPRSILFWPGLILCLAVLWVRFRQAVQYKMSLGSILFHPLGCLIFAVIGLNSVRWFWFGGGHWKGRTLKRTTQRR